PQEGVLHQLVGERAISAIRLTAQPPLETSFTVLHLSDSETVTIVQPLRASRSDPVNRLRTCSPPWPPRVLAGIQRRLRLVELRLRDHVGIVAGNRLADGFPLSLLHMRLVLAEYGAVAQDQGDVAVTPLPAPPLRCNLLPIQRVGNGPCAVTVN